MPAVRSFAKSCIVLLLGKESKPRRILSGLASGYRISVSPAENLSYLLGTAETHLQKAIRQYVTPSDAVYDIGANLGYVSLSLAKRVGPQGSVIAFEPVPLNIAAFRNNIAVNGITNVRLLEYAASDRAGESIIRLAENSSTASLVWHRDNSSATELSVRTVSIDDLVDAGDVPHPKFAKIDVEGAEGPVLKGMQRTIAAVRPVLFVECSEAGRQTAWPLLVGLNYRCQSAITRKEIKTLDEYRHSDFLWLPAEKL
jgi:FkbM family methyltransferase